MKLSLYRMSIKQLTLVVLATLLLPSVAPAVVLADSSAMPTGIPSPTGHTTESTIKNSKNLKNFKMYKNHQWNLLEIAKYDADKNGTYETFKPRADFSMSIPNKAWATEGVTSMSFQEICRTTAERFATNNGISNNNWLFVSYRGYSNAYKQQDNTCATKNQIWGDQFGIAVYLRGTPIKKQEFRWSGAAASAYGNRGFPCVKTRYLGKVLAACTIHTEFQNNAADRFWITRAETMQFYYFAQNFAQSSTPADHTFFQGDFNLSPKWHVNSKKDSKGSAQNNPQSIIGNGYHGYNVGTTTATVNKYMRIDYIFADNKLIVIPDSVPLCKGVGIVTAKSAAAYPGGDHCYIGTTFFEYDKPQLGVSQDQGDTADYSNDPAIGLSADSPLEGSAEDDATISNTNNDLSETRQPDNASPNIIPGAPKAGDLSGQKIGLLAAGLVLIGTSLVWRRVKQRT